MLRSVPLGGITAWSGAIVDIPSAYSLCDGTNGTPDLRDRFIPGADLTFAVGQEGGTVNHAHDFTSDGHSHALIPSGDLSPGGTLLNNTTSEVVTGTTVAASNLPLYYSLAFIMHTG
ncbi:hypothetical protein KAR91_72360 [Candidatus Pacearchaeota archaeon]|nr:hypothetical protein [Candidatus Pacearchaeota archaeon]